MTHYETGTLLYQNCSASFIFFEKFKPKHFPFTLLIMNVNHQEQNKSELKNESCNVNVGLVMESSTSEPLTMIPGVNAHGETNNSTKHNQKQWEGDF